MTEENRTPSLLTKAFNFCRQKGLRPIFRKITQEYQELNLPERFAIQFHRRFRPGKTDAIRAKPGLFERQDITLIFMHIPKTAGTSIRSLLQGLVPPRESVYLYPQGKAISKEEFDAFPAERKAQIRVVMGHVMYGIHELLPQQVRYVTMLRDPVDRVVSLYHHIKRIPEHPLHQSVVEKNLTLEGFVFSGRFLGADNEMVRHISGVRGLGFGECSADLLKVAYHNIETHFECVLLMENMPRSIARLSEILEIPVKGFLKKNVNWSRQSDSSIDPGLVKKINALNCYDRALYDRVKQGWKA